MLFDLFERRCPGRANVLDLIEVLDFVECRASLNVSGLRRTLSGSLKVAGACQCCSTFLDVAALVGRC